MTPEEVEKEFGEWWKSEEFNDKESPFFAALIKTGAKIAWVIRQEKLDKLQSRIQELEDGIRKHKMTDWEIIVEHPIQSKNLQIICQRDEELYKLLGE